MAGEGVSDQCAICGVDLKAQDHPLARFLGWPPAFLPGDVPSDDEICRRCLADLGRAREIRMRPIADDPLIQAVLADAGLSITVRLGDPHHENRLLPMKLSDV
jgi:hypothetical protein